MTTQVLFDPSGSMGEYFDSNKNNNENALMNQLPAALLGVLDGGGRTASAAILSLSIPSVTTNPSKAVVEERSEAPSLGSTLSKDKNLSIMFPTSTSTKSFATTNFGALDVAMNASPSSTSFNSTAAGKDTGIVSHLRGISSVGNSLQKMKSVRAEVISTSKNSDDTGGGATSSSSLITIRPGHSSPAASASGCSINSKNMAPAGSLVSGANPGNSISALIFQGQMNLMAATAAAAAAMNKHTNNHNSNGMILPNPNVLLAAQMGSGNFDILAGLNTGSRGSDLHPRVGANAAAAMFGGFSAAAVAMRADSQKPKYRSLPLYIGCDTDSLSEYQCLIRQQIELFEADKTEATSSVQGRNKQILEGQVGIRCRHCASVPPRQRQKGSMYFPTKLDRIYQAAQNLSTFHLCDNCKHIPDNIRKRILLLRERKSPAGGGKRYWGEGVRCLGVVEDQNGLRFR